MSMLLVGPLIMALLMSCMRIGPCRIALLLLVRLLGMTFTLCAREEAPSKGLLCWETMVTVTAPTAICKCCLCVSATSRRVGVSTSSCQGTARP